MKVWDKILLTSIKLLALLDIGEIRQIWVDCFSESKLQITNYKSQIANYKSQITNHKMQITNYKLQCVDYKLQITNHKLQKNKLQI